MCALRLKVWRRLCKVKLVWDLSAYFVKFEALGCIFSLYFRRQIVFLSLASLKNKRTSSQGKLKLKEQSSSHTQKSWNSSKEMAEDEGNRPHNNRPSLKSHISFNNYPKWKDKVAVGFIELLNMRKFIVHTYRYCRNFGNLRLILCWFDVA